MQHFGPQRKSGDHLEMVVLVDDWSGRGASDPLSLNGYAYAYNDPTRLSDPSGHNPIVGAFDWLATEGCTVGRLWPTTSAFCSG